MPVFISCARHSWIASGVCPTRKALRTAFGLDTGEPPDQFLVGLAVLGLLSGVAEERPLVCVVDDLHWQDRASAQTFGLLRADC